MDIPTLTGQAQGRRPVLGVEQLVVAASGLCRQVATVTSHALMNNEHAGVRAVFADHIKCETCTLVRRGPCAQRLTDRNNVIIDGLRKANHGEFVVVLVQVSCKICCGRICVVTADGVQNINAILAQLLGSKCKRVDAFFNQASVDKVLCIGQLDARVTDGRTTKLAKNTCVTASFFVNDNIVAGQKAVVAVLVKDDFYLGSNLGVALDEITNSSRKTGGKATSGQESNTTNRHESTFQFSSRAAREARQILILSRV